MVRSHQRIASLFLLGIVALSSRAQAQDFILGYQLGVVQGAGAGQSNDPFQFDLDDQIENTLDQPLVSRFTGVNLSTQLTGNLTLDIPGRWLEQSFLAGASLDQQIPYNAPEQLRAELQQAQTSLVANGNYLLRHVRPTHGIALNLGYAFVQNGRLSNAGGGASSSLLAETLPGASAAGGVLTVTDDTHTANVELQLELTQQNWDLSIVPGYVFTDNGVFNLLDNGVPGGAADDFNLTGATCGGVPNLATTGTTTPGCFILATVHDFSLRVENRIRLSRRHNLNTDAQMQWFIPRIPEEDQAQPIQETLITEGNISYLYNRVGVQNFGIGFNATYGLRSPENPFLLLGPEVLDSQESRSEFDESLRPDTFIYGVSFLYNDRYRLLELDLNLELGFAQANLLQPPIGALPAPECPLLGGCQQDQLIFFSADDFAPIRAAIEPQFRLTLAREFEPFNLELVALREVGLGALGASALVTTGAGVNLRHALRLNNGEAIVTTLGTNIAELEPVGEDLFLGFDDVGQLAAQLQNRVIAFNANIEIPLFEVGDTLFDATFTYNYVYVDQDPTGELRDLQTQDAGLDNQVARVGNVGPPIPLSPTETHLGVLAVRGVWGRGSLQTARGGGGGPPRDQFSQDPRTGGPLGSARLVNGDQPLLDGTAGRAPGMPREATSARQRHQQQKRRLEESKKRVNRGRLLNQNKTAQQEREEADREEDRKRKESEEKRTRDFGDWPIEPPPPDDT
ncbi:MAG: hypothetical protein VYC39_08175 [Myxococcota bacterium]|nr:hypothetical protein [Myxococcota bacterium]